MSKQRLNHALLRRFIFSSFAVERAGRGRWNVIESFQVSRANPAAQRNVTGAVATYAIIVASNVISS